MKKPIFTGSCVALCTPFNKDGAVNYDELKKLIEWHIENDTDAITICGTTGETATLSDIEHKEVMKFAVDTANKRITIIAGTGSNDTNYAINLSKYAEEIGVDGLLCVTPYYNKTTQAGLVKHFTAIADNVNIPVILYNVPSRTGVSIKPETYKELSKHANINGVKEASGDISLVAQIRATCPNDFYIWSGNDDQIVPLMSLGGVGVISVLANIAPKETHKLTTLCLEENYIEARKMQCDYLHLIDMLFCEVNPIPVKSALKFMGFNMGDLRLPLTELSIDNQKQLKSAMDDLKI